MDLEAIRAELGVLDRLVWLNTGTFGPLPRRTLDAMAAADRLDYERGRTGAWYPAEILELRERLRAALAAVVSVPPETLALTRSTTEGCSIVCAGLGVGPGDEVVTTDVEHFGLLGPLAASGATVRPAKLRGRPPEAALDAIAVEVGPATKLIAVSHVAWTTGQLLPLDELAGLGVPVLADGAQSVGAIPVTATGVDFYAFSGQKWLLGPGGTGGLVIAPEWIERLAVAAPSYYSQDGYDEAGAFTPKAGCRPLRLRLAQPRAARRRARLARLPRRGRSGALRARPHTGRARPGAGRPARRAGERPRARRRSSRGRAATPRGSRGASPSRA